VLLFGVCAWVLQIQISEHRESLWLLKDEAPSFWLRIISTILLFGIAMGIRSHRWVLCLNRPDLLSLSFRSIAIGYLVQCPLSKLGEVVRMTNQKRHSDLSLGEILSTVTIDRLLDVFFLLLLLFISTFLGGGLIQENFSEFEGLLPKLTLMFFLLKIFLIFIFVFHKKVGNLISSIPILPTKLKQGLISFLNHFNIGLKNCRSFPMLTYLLLSTIAIWVLYFVMFYLLVSPWSVMPDLTFDEAFILFIIGTLGVLVPVPGGLAMPLFLQQGILLIHPEVGEGMSLSISLFAYFINFWLVNLVNGGISWVWQMFVPPQQVKLTHG
jgi:glycosyltransferase 2 family protein